MKRVIVEKATNKTEQYQVAEVDFSGRKFLDIRTFYLKDGEWLPTKKGVMVPVEMAQDIYKAIKKVGKQYFDLAPPPGDEQSAEDKALKKVLKKSREDWKEKEEKEAKASGIQRRKKLPKEVVAETKKIGKKVAREMLEEIDAKIAKKGKKKKNKKLKVEATELPVKKKKKLIEAEEVATKKKKIAKSKRPS